MIQFTSLETLVCVSYVFQGECFASTFKCKHCLKPHNNLLNIDIKVEGASNTDSVSNSNTNSTNKKVIPSISQCKHFIYKQCSSTCSKYIIKITRK